MSDVKIHLKESLTQQQAADKLSDLASALAKGGDVDVEVDGVEVRLRIRDDVPSEFDMEANGNELRFKLEFKLLTGHAETAFVPADKSEDNHRPWPLPDL